MQSGCPYKPSQLEVLNTLFKYEHGYAGKTVIIYARPLTVFPTALNSYQVSLVRHDSSHDKFNTIEFTNPRRKSHYVPANWVFNQELGVYQDPAYEFIPKAGSSNRGEWKLKSDKAEPTKKSS
jgi:hypothetical protein